MDEEFMLNPILDDYKKIDEPNLDVSDDELVDIDTKIVIPENVSDIESSETNESPKDKGEEEVRHKKFRRYFLHVEDDDVNLDFVLPVLHGKPANGKFYVFERRKDAQQIINHLVTLGKQAAILGDSIRYTSKNKVPTK